MNWRSIASEPTDTPPTARWGRVRRDLYRHLARKASRQVDLSRRRVTDNRPSAVSVPTRARHETLTPTGPALAAERFTGTDNGAWAAKIQIRCFGHFEVSREGVVVQRWRRRSAERLLKFLVVNGRRVHRDVLLDVLWPGVPAESSIRGLRVTLHALRRAVAAAGPDPEPVDLIRTDEDTYILNTDGVWIDADAFSKHYYAGLRFERQKLMEPAAGEYAVAADLYRDDFLVEDLYEDWTVLRREELKDQYLLVLTKLSQLCLAASDLDGCIMHCHALLAKEPCREDAYQRLIQCYTLLGQRGRAVRWYEICERTLLQGLDTAPSDETHRLYLEVTSA